MGDQQAQQSAEGAAGGYVGESTHREIGYAESLGTPVRYLSRERPAGAGDNVTALECSAW